MRTTDEIFLFLCKNSNYYKRSSESLKEKKKQYKEEDGKCFNKKYYYFVETLVPAFECELSILEKFLGESYSFPKHMKPLVDQGMIYIRPYRDCFPHSEKLSKEHLEMHGLVKNYDTDVDYLHWYLGNKDPNKNHNVDNAWL